MTTKVNIVNGDLSFVIFDGTSHYVVDRQDMLQITSSDKDTEVVFKAFCVDKCQDKADELNELL